MCTHTHTHLLLCHRHPAICPRRHSPPAAWWSSRGTRDAAAGPWHPWAVPPRSPFHCRPFRSRRWRVSALHWPWSFFFFPFVSCFTFSFFCPSLGLPIKLFRLPPHFSFLLVSFLSRTKKQLVVRAGVLVHIWYMRYVCLCVFVFLEHSSWHFLARLHTSVRWDTLTDLRAARLVYYMSEWCRQCCQRRAAKKLRAPVLPSLAHNG